MNYRYIIDSATPLTLLKNGGRVVIVPDDATPSSPSIPLGEELSFTMADGYSDAISIMHIPTPQLITREEGKA
jgi:hypothetical protein